MRLARLLFLCSASHRILQYIRSKTWPKSILTVDDFFEEKIDITTRLGTAGLPIRLLRKYLGWFWRIIGCVMMMTRRIRRRRHMKRAE